MSRPTLAERLLGVLDAAETGLTEEEARTIEVASERLRGPDMDTAEAHLGEAIEQAEIAREKASTGLAGSVGPPRRDARLTDAIYDLRGVRDELREEREDGKAEVSSKWSGSEGE